MESDEQNTTRPDPLDGFVIPGSWARSIPTDFEEFLAPSPVPIEPPPSTEIGEASLESALSSFVASNEPPLAFQQPAATGEGRIVLSAIVAERPILDAAVEAPPSRAVSDEAASMAAAEPRALVAPADVFNAPLDRIREHDESETKENGEVFRALFDEGGLVDPSAWFSSVGEPDAPRESPAASPSLGFRSTESAALASLSPSGFDWNDSGGDGAGGSASLPRADRVDGLSSGLLDEVEARLSRVASKLEAAADRIDPAASEPLSARAGVFRGRVDDRA